MYCASFAIQSFEEPSWDLDVALQEMSVNISYHAALHYAEPRQRRPPLRSARPVESKSSTPTVMPLSLIQSVVSFGLAKYRGHTASSKKPSASSKPII
ncbi:hypothetical protein IAQ61_004231 [Plenodomus lingam]|uniref:uncharacterized protein n=1 Tax=Leptosphaeria maculans TaxID=5022 RepID=UPI003332F47F|nr:hypothetical protein IAQ61_004231 [Plenodomus lingam]